MLLENNRKSWMFLICLAAGIAISGCGAGGGDAEDEDEDEPDCCEPAPDPTGNLTGSWLAESTNYNHIGTSTDPANSYHYVGTGNRKEIFVINNLNGLAIWTCGRGVFSTGAVSNIENTNTTLSFDYADSHYELDKVDTDSLEGTFTTNIVYSNTETTTEDGDVTFHKFKTLSSEADAFIGQLNFQLNDDPLDTVYLACFMQNQVQSSDVVGGSATEMEVAVAGVDESGNFEGIYADNAHRNSAPEAGWREFVFHLNGVSVFADRDADDTLAVDISSTFADDIFQFDISATGSGTDASGDAFTFEFNGDGGLGLSVDASGDASSDAP
jgi:hypothetical protein